MLENIGQCDVKQMTLPIKTIMSVLKVSTYNITSITARPDELAAILAIMSVLVLHNWRYSIFYIPRYDRTCHNTQV